MTTEKLTFLDRGGNTYYVLLSNRNLGYITAKYEKDGSWAYAFQQKRHYIPGYDDQIKSELFRMNIIRRLKGTP
jgi:hypothetical protein